MRLLFQERTYSLTFTIVLVGLVAAMVFPQTFPTFGNWSQLLLNLSIDTIVAVGMMLLLVSGVFDLSVGSVVAFSGGVAAYGMMTFGMPVPFALLLALVSAGLIGAVNGYLIAYQGINPMIQTLAAMGIVRGALYSSADQVFRIYRTGSMPSASRGCWVFRCRSGTCCLQWVRLLF
ncbi:hypothetical protein LN737_25480 [Spirosoma sp. KNUC1025]|nr:hypothetical protein LN737_25480 [Spirosoma sp. KNUC1025]